MRQHPGSVACGSAIMAIALAGLIDLGAPARAQQVGTAGAVNPDAKALAGGATRVIELGSAIVHKERIQTSGQGSVQLVFIDKTTMNIGPNSDLVIDDFVYDPKTATGKMSATLGKGVLRVVGGNVTHNGGATINTPVATIGIRGGVAVISHDEGNCAKSGSGKGSRCTSVDNVFGQLTVNSQGGEEVIRRPGYGVMVDAAGGAPSAPALVNQSIFDSTNRLLTSKGAQTGGAPIQPSDRALNTDIAGRTPLQIAANGINPLSDPSLQASRFGQGAQQGPVISRQQQATVKTASNVQLQNAAPQAFALTMSADPTLGSGLPYLLGSFAASGSYTVSPVLGYRSAAYTANGVTIQPIQTLQAGLSINGQGASQTSTLFVAVSSLGNGISAGGLRASTRLAAGQAPGFAAGAVNSQGAVLLGTNGLPASYAVSANAYNAAGGLVQAGNAISFPGPPPISTYNYAQTAAATTLPAGFGSDRPAVTLSGFVGGLMRSFVFANASAQSGYALGPAFATNGSAQIQLDPVQSRVQANFNLAAQTQSGSGVDSYASGAYQLGSVQPLANARSAYVDSHNFAAIDATSDGSAASLQNGISTVNGGLLRSNNLMMVTADTVGASAMFPGVGFCDCEYTRWGFWSADTSRNSATSLQTLADRGSLMTWVAGILPDVGTIPTSGQATYGGHVVATVTDGASQYVAAGNFANTVDYGAKTGTISISNLDNRSYSGRTSLNPADPRYFTGSGATLTGPNAAMFQLNGSFFKGSTGPAQEMGGNILLQGIGTTYLGSGIFAARR